jgi:uncharacterized protein YlxW (UPF0749 family)
MERINCCVLALVAFCGNIIQLVFFFNYSLRLKDKSIKLEKNDKEQENKHNQNCRRIEELEKKNGAEQRQINELKEQIKQLEKKLSKYE